MQFLYVHFKHPHILRTLHEFCVRMFFLQYTILKTSQIKKVVRPSTLRTWKTWRKRTRIDSIATDFRGIFRRDSVGILPWWKIHGIDGITTEPVFLFLHVPSVLGSNWLFHPRCLGGDRLQKKNSTTKIHLKSVTCWGVWNANTRIAFLFADALLAYAWAL